MKTSKNSVITSIRFFTIASLMIAMTGCGAGNNKDLADSFGDAAAAATSGITCFILGC